VWPCHPVAVHKGYSESNGIPVTGCGGVRVCETSRLPHFLDIRLTDGGEIVSLMQQLSFTPRESGYSFLFEAESTPGP
jgi:hypothetical protein